MAAVAVVLVAGDVVTLPGDVVVVLPGDVLQEQVVDEVGGLGTTTGGIILPTDAEYSLVQLFTANTSNKTTATNLLMSKSN